MEIGVIRRRLRLIERRNQALAGEIALPLGEWIEIMLLRPDAPGEAPWYPGIPLRIEKPVALKVGKLPKK